MVNILCLYKCIFKIRYDTVFLYILYIIIYRNKRIMVSQTTFFIFFIFFYCSLFNNYNFIQFKVIISTDNSIKIGHRVYILNNVVCVHDSL